MLVAGKILKGSFSPHSNTKTNNKTNNHKNVSKINEFTTIFNVTQKRPNSTQNQNIKQAQIRKDALQMQQIISSPMKPHLVFNFNSKQLSEEALFGYLRSHRFSEAISVYQAAKPKNLDTEDFIYLLEVAFSKKEFHGELAKIYRDIIAHKPSVVAVNYFLFKSIQHNLVKEPIVPYSKIFKDLLKMKEKSPTSFLHASTFAYFFHIFSEVGNFEGFEIVFKKAVDFPFNEIVLSKNDVAFNSILSSKEFQDFKKVLNNDAKAEQALRKEFDIDPVIVEPKNKLYREKIEELHKTEGAQDEVIEEYEDEYEDEDEDADEVDDEVDGDDMEEDEELDEQSMALEEAYVDQLRNSSGSFVPKLFPFIFSRCEFSKIDEYFNAYLENTELPREETFAAIFDRINIEISKDINEKRPEISENDLPFLDINPELLRKLHKYYIHLKQHYPLNGYHLQILLSKSTSSAIADKYTTLFLLEGIKMTEGCYNTLFDVYKKDANAQKKIDELYAHMILSMEDPRFDRSLYTEEQIQTMQEEEWKIKQKLIEAEVAKKYPNREDGAKLMEEIESNIKTQSPLVDFHHRGNIASAMDKLEEERNSWFSFRNACDQRLKKEITLRQLKKLVHDPRWPAYVKDYISPDAVTRPLLQSLEKASDVLLNYVHFIYQLSSVDNQQEELDSSSVPATVADNWLKEHGKDFSFEKLIADLAPYSLNLRLEIAQEVLVKIYTESRKSVEELKNVEDQIYRTAETASLNVFHDRLLVHEQLNKLIDEAGSYKPYDMHDEEIEFERKLEEGDFHREESVPAVKDLNFEKLAKEGLGLFYPEQVQQSLFALAEDYYKNDEEYMNLPSEEKLEKIFELMKNQEKKREMIGVGIEKNPQRLELFLKFEKQYFENYFEVSKDFENFKKMLADQDPVSTFNIFRNKYQTLDNEKLGFVTEKLLTTYGTHVSGETAVTKSSDWDDDSNEFRSGFDVFDYTINPIKALGYNSASNVIGELPKNTAISDWRKNLREAREGDAAVKYLAKLAQQRLLNKLLPVMTGGNQEGSIQNTINDIKEILSLKDLSAEEYATKVSKLYEELRALNESTLCEVIAEHNAKLVSRSEQLNREMDDLLDDLREDEFEQTRISFPYENRFDLDDDNYVVFGDAASNIPFTMKELEEMENALDVAEGEDGDVAEGEDGDIVSVENVKNILTESIKEMDDLIDDYRQDYLEGLDDLDDEEYDDDDIDADDLDDDDIDADGLDDDGIDADGLDDDGIDADGLDDDGIDADDLDDEEKALIEEFGGYDALNDLYDDDDFDADDYDDDDFDADDYDYDDIYDNDNYINHYDDDDDFVQYLANDGDNYDEIDDDADLTDPAVQNFILERFHNDEIDIDELNDYQISQLFNLVNNSEKSRYVFFSREMEEDENDDVENEWEGEDKAMADEVDSLFQRLTQGENLDVLAALAKSLPRRAMMKQLNLNNNLDRQYDLNTTGGELAAVEEDENEDGADEDQEEEGVSFEEMLINQIKENTQKFDKLTQGVEGSEEIAAEWWTQIIKDSADGQEKTLKEMLSDAQPSNGSSSGVISKGELKNYFPNLSAEETSKLEELIDHTNQLGAQYKNIYASKEIPVQTLSLVKDILTGRIIFAEETEIFIENNPKGISYSEFTDPEEERELKDHPEIVESFDAIDQEVEDAETEVEIGLLPGDYDSLEKRATKDLPEEFDQYLAREFDYKEYHQTEAKEAYQNFTLEELQQHAEVFKEDKGLTPYQQFVIKSFTYKDILETNNRLLARKDSELEPGSFVILPQNDISGTKELLKEDLYSDVLDEVEQGLRDFNPNFPPQITHDTFRNLIRYQAEVGGDFEKAIGYYNDLISYRIRPSEGVYYWLFKMAKDKYQESHYDKFLEAIDVLYHEWKIYLSDQVPSKRIDDIINVLASRKKDILHVGRLKYDPVYRAKNLLQEEYLNNPKRFEIMVNEQYCNQIEFKGHFHHAIANHGLEKMFKDEAYRELQPILFEDKRNERIIVDGANVKIHLDNQALSQFEYRRSALHGFTSGIEQINDEVSRLQAGITKGESFPENPILQLSVPERNPEEKRIP